MTFSRINPRLLAAGAAAATLTLAACSPRAQAAPDEMARAADLVRRGDYLVHSIGCDDCHTPLAMGPNGPERDMSRMLSGHPETMKMPPAPDHGDSPWAWSGSITSTAFAGPWGVSFAMNLTPDENTGIGIWTEDMFVKAIRTGRHMGVSRAILPPMPWQVIRNLTDDDLRAIYAYLRTIKPITNHVPDPLPPASPQPSGTPGGVE